jgi:hypothetical protein
VSIKEAGVKKRNWLSAASGLVLAVTIVGAAEGASAQATTGPYPNMAPREQYMMDKEAEIAMARSAAPPSISDDAAVLVLGAHGFERAAKGTNHFVCLVDRSWNKSFDDPEFWDPKSRGPMCLNEAAVRTVLPAIVERAEWALSGLSLAEIAERLKTSPKANTTPATGAMAYMLSKQQYLSESGTHYWYPHVMFFSPPVDPGAWGANLKASPVLGAVISSRLTMFFIPVRKWSDGTLADYGPSAGSTGQHHH